MNEPAPPKRPPIVFWYNVYLVVNALMYLAFALAVPAFLIYRGEGYGLIDLECQVYAVLAFLLFFPLMLVHLVPFVMKASPRAWLYGWFIIVLGLTGCLFPANIFLMIYWPKAETKRFYGKD